MLHLLGQCPLNEALFSSVSAPTPSVDSSYLFNGCLVLLFSLSCSPWSAFIYSCNNFDFPFLFGWFVLHLLGSDVLIPPLGSFSPILHFSHPLSSYPSKICTFSLQPPPELLVRCLLPISGGLGLQQCGAGLGFPMRN